MGRCLRWISGGSSGSGKELNAAFCEQPKFQQTLVILKRRGIKDFFRIGIHQKQNVLNLNPLQTTGPTSLIPQIGLVAFLCVQTGLLGQVIARDRGVKPHTHELGVVRQVKFAMNFAVHCGLFQKNRHAT